MKKENKILLIGIGNSGRNDDALGWLFLDNLEKDSSIVYDLEYRYQLQIEDADLIKDYEKVIFIDSTIENVKNGFYYRICKSENNHSFTTHGLDPEAILYLCNTLYNYYPESYVIGIQGYEWDLKTGLSQKGIRNLNAALKYFREKFNKLIVTD